MLLAIRATHPPTPSLLGRKFRKRFSREGELKAFGLFFGLASPSLLNQPLRTVITVERGTEGVSGYLRDLNN
jgi:hypothetical protein